MLKFENGELSIKRIEVPEHDVDMYKAQRDSYTTYLTKTVYDDVNYMCSRIKDIYGLEFDYTVTVGKRYTTEYVREVERMSDSYYAVYLNIIMNGMVSDNIELMKIPYMDEKCILNMHGDRRVIVNQLVPYPDMSYDDKNNKFILSLEYLNSVVFFLYSAGIKIQYFKEKMDAFTFTAAYYAQQSVELEEFKQIVNAYLLSRGDVEYIDSYAAALVLEEHKAFGDYQSSQYSLGKSRESLMLYLSLDRALNKTLSRDVLQYKAGTIVTKEVLTNLKRNLINCVYVRALPALSGFYPKNDVIIRFIQKGTRNCVALKRLFPQYVDLYTIPLDLDLADNPIVVKAGVRLSKEALELLYYLDFRELECARTKKDLMSAKEDVSSLRTYYFEQEILGNYICRLGDVKTIEGRSPEELVYFYNNKDLAPNLPKQLTPHDLSAILSFIGYTRVFDDYKPLNRDISFRKRIFMFNELFSEVFRSVVTSFLTSKPTHIKFSKIAKTFYFERDMFFGVGRDIPAKLWSLKYIKAADILNPLANVTQINNVVSQSKSGRYSDDIRLIPMGHFGRLCPFETPAGQKLGATNTLTVGAKIDDTVIKTPYRRVLKHANGEISITSIIDYLSADEELRYVIGDSLSICSRHKDDHVLARVNAGNGAMTFETVKTSDLDYVEAFPEQILSPSVMLMPFANTDDSIRITYATNQLKQSILLQRSEKPYVYTSYYKQIASGNKMVLKAEADGEVWGLDKDLVQVTYEDGRDVNYEIEETVVYNGSLSLVNIRVSPKQKFNKGDILAETANFRDGVYSPGINLLTAYIPTGYNYEDSVDISRTAANKLTSVSAHTVTKTITLGRGESIEVRESNIGEYISEGEIIDTILLKRGNSLSREPVHIIAKRVSGIYNNYDIVREDSITVKIKFHLVGINATTRGDKLVGRHSNKGTSARVCDDNEMPVFKNGEAIEIVYNPCGVLSRLNVGQLLECALGFVAYLLDIHVETDPINGATKEEVELLLNYVYDLANTENVEVVISKYTGLPVDLHNVARARYEELRHWKNCFNRDGTAILYDYTTREYLNSPATIGVSYVFKLKQESEGRIHARAGILDEETYNLVTNQPTKGATRGGGQRIGEMELASLLAHGASATIREITNEKSDNIRAKLNHLAELVGREDLVVDGLSNPYSVLVFLYKLQALGIKVIDVDGDILEDISIAASRHKPTLSDTDVITAITAS
ncbi:MAG: hypothetical protein LBS29_05065 [Endomicrobium sp.]|jgi:DNA-directed RNA polymerase beta subunit|nr:hypothetical protein [Endomicrobium sp.]